MKFTLKELFDDLVSSVAVRLEKEYLYYEVFDDGRPPQNFGGTCFVTPPAKGEYYIIHRRDKVIDNFIVVNVAHSHNSDYAGYLYLKRVKQIEL